MEKIPANREIMSSLMSPLTILATPGQTILHNVGQRLVKKRRDRRVDGPSKREYVFRCGKMWLTQINARIVNVLELVECWNVAHAYVFRQTYHRYKLDLEKPGKIQIF